MGMAADYLPWGLVVVDMQRYFLEPTAAYTRYHNLLSPGCMDYMSKRCANVVTPNVARLLALSRTHARPVIFLRLCGASPDRSDLHHAFRSAHVAAAATGVPGLYPLSSEQMSDVSPVLAPRAGEHVLCKTTFSAFTSTDIEAVLKGEGLRRLVFVGTATSQCVEATARDAADRGIDVVMVEDAQADYSHAAHAASLFSSQGVCGGYVCSTDDVLAAGWVREPPPDGHPLG